MSRPPICYIVGALPLASHHLPQPQAGDFLIAADGGYPQLMAAGLTPHLIVGDFDSAPVPSLSNTRRLPAIKDETDVGFALSQGLERGYTRFVILGGLGGLLDHTVANLQLLHSLSQGGAQGLLMGEGQCATVLTEQSIHFPSQMRGRCSVFAWGGDVAAATLVGLKYPLMGEPLSPQFPLGVSNEFTGLPATITAQGGSLLAIWDWPHTTEEIIQLLYKEG